MPGLRFGMIAGDVMILIALHKELCKVFAGRCWVTGVRDASSRGC